MSVITKTIEIGQIPAIIWGSPAPKSYFYVHGQEGCKEEAAILANIICPHGFQVLSIDLPEHGERKERSSAFVPWDVVPELQLVLNFAKEKWRDISLYASSIGAWFCMQGLEGEPFQNCMFVSPIVDMVQLIKKMMGWAKVTETQLCREKVITASFGQTLSWDYWQYAVERPVADWRVPTKILYGEKDEMTDCDTVREFARQFHCGLTVVQRGGHWFHTDRELSALTQWISENFERQ